MKKNVVACAWFLVNCASAAAGMGLHINRTARVTSFFICVTAGRR